MSSPEFDEAEQDQAGDAAAERPRAADWLWHPWYAKAWWAAIPLYWLPAGGPTRIEALAGFYESGWAVVPNLLFIPITALLVLGFGYFRELFATGTPIADFAHDYFDGTQPGRPSPTMDMFNPRSGPLWIGNRPID